MATTKQFVSVLKRMSRPGGRQVQFLRAHYRASGRAMTATTLARAVGYKDYRGINLWYGRLADTIGAELGLKNPRLSLLVDFVRPRDVTNTEWILVMRPEFAAALKQAGWV
jgi:hypothetical protein